MGNLLPVHFNSMCVVVLYNHFDVKGAVVLMISIRTQQTNRGWTSGFPLLFSTNCA